MIKDEFIKEVYDIIQSNITNPQKTAEHIAEKAIEYFRTIHSRSLACHCECLGMNAENAIACCGNYSPPYSDGHYWKVMKKWGVIDSDGKPLI